MYTVFDYQKDLRKILNEHKEKNIIIVGGTGLYIKAGLYNYEFEEESKTQNNYDNYSNEEIYKILKEKDPNTNIHINNRKRIIRALNTDFQNNNKKHELLYDAIFIGLTTNRDNLYKIINDRVDNMFENGLLEEVELLYNEKIYGKSIATGIGYKELYAYFDNKISLEEAKELIKKNSRHYAKRQYTWFNNQMDINWFETNYDDFNKTINEIVAFIEKE